MLIQHSYPLDDSIITNAFFKTTEKATNNTLDIFCSINHDSKIIGLKEKMVDFMASKYPDMFDKCANDVLYQDIKGKENNDYYNDFISDKIKFHCWAYILNTYDSLQQSGVLDHFFVKRGFDMFKEFKKYNYFGLTGLQEYCKYAETMTKEQLSSGKYDN